jgi:uncharacterized membrane protein YraQ (UPF0718 family)
MLNFIAKEGVLLSSLFFGVSMLVALMQQSVGQRLTAALVKVSLGTGTALAATAGAVTPFCSCSTVPILTGMLRAQVRFGVAFTFLVASPVINEGLLLVLLRHFSLQEAAIFLVVAIITSMGLGIAVDRLRMGRFTKLPAPTPVINAVRLNDGTLTNVPLAAKLRFAAATAINELRSAAPYLLVGILVGALIYGDVPDDAISTLQHRFPGTVLILVMALVGVPFYINSSMVVPIALALLMKGLTIGPVAAFLVSGAGTSIPEMILLTKLFKLPLMVSHFIAIVVAATVIGVALEWAVYLL